jgi:CheY-like chemotaxis protein
MRRTSAKFLRFFYVPRAWTWSRHHDFDVVLTDLGLPDISGDVVIRRVLASARRRPRIIVVTGYDEPFVSRAKQAGADAVFNKPVVWTTIARMLSSARERIRDEFAAA